LAWYLGTQLSVNTTCTYQFLATVMPCTYDNF